MNHPVITIEALELRIAPATLVTPGTVSFTDIDGDTVVVKTTRGTFDLMTDFEFMDFGGGREQLAFLNLSASEFDGARIKVFVSERGAESDGLVNVGYINGGSIDLRGVAVAGDLGRIDAGDDDLSTPGLGTLKVRSVGLHGTATQTAGGDLSSSIKGNLGKVFVSSDFREAALVVSGRLGTLTIGGSLIGEEETVAIAGFISANEIGAVKIGRDIIGGAGATCGVIDSRGPIASVSVGGSLIGGAGVNSGVIRSDAELGLVKIGQDVIGGTGTSSALIFGGGGIASVNVGGSVIGGIGTNSAAILSDGEVGPVKIGGSVLGNGPFICPDCQCEWDCLGQDCRVTGWAGREECSDCDGRRHRTGHHWVEPEGRCWR
jgi:hypothetical protein